MRDIVAIMRYIISINARYCSVNARYCSINARYCSVNARYPAVVHGADIVVLMRYILQWYPAYECICVDVYLCVCERE